MGTGEKFSIWGQEKNFQYGDRRKIFNLKDYNIIETIQV